MSTPERAETSLAGQPVEYETRRSTEATEPRIDVDIGGVVVVLPDGSDTDPEQLLQENANWVLDKRTKYQAYREQAPERTFEPGETFPYLGEEHELVVESRSQADVVDGTLRIRQSAVDQSSVKRALENFYRRRARDHFADRADHYAEEMGVEYGKIEIRNQRTKWGSCSTTGTLGLNWRLMMAPPEIVDYVVVHELAHLREPTHDDDFWALVGEHDPNYRAHAEWLTDNSTQLIFSGEDL